MIVEVTIIETSSPESSPVDDKVNKARERAFNNKGINSNVYHYNLQGQSSDVVNRVKSEYNVNQLPAVVIRREGDSTIRRKLEGGGQLNEQNIYKAITYNEIGGGNEGLPIDGGSGGVLPVFSWENLPNILKGLVGNKNIKIGLVMLAIYLIINNEE